MTDIVNFCLKSSQSDFLKYCMIASALQKHHYSGWKCWELTDEQIGKYNKLINELFLKYE